MFALIKEIAWSDPTLWLLAVGVALAASSSAIIGTFNLLGKKGLAGDALAHSFLPGVCIAFLLAGHKSLWVLLLGCFFSGGVALFLLYYLPKEKKIKAENSVAVVLALSLGVGLLLLSYIQHHRGGSQVGLQSFLLGSTSSLMEKDLWYFGGLNVLLFVATLLLFRPWRLVLFDGDFARVIGEPVKRVQFVFHLLSLLSIVMGVQTVGVVLMSSTLLAPAMGARFWTNRLGRMVCVALFLAVLGSLLGLFCSFLWVNLPVGPCIALSMNGLALLSFFVAPRRGWLARRYRRANHREKVLEENILKFLYLKQREESTVQGYSIDGMSKIFLRSLSHFQERMPKLSQKGWVVAFGKGWRLSEGGMAQGAHIYKLHLLWEAYLKHHLGIQADHVHEDAEAIEHMITPALEKELWGLVGDKIRMEEKEGHYSMDVAKVDAMQKA